MKASKAGKTGPSYKGILTYEDILKTVQYLVKLHAGEDGYETDDIDHFGNRRLRSVGELIQNQLRIGLSRMERVVKERMTTQDVEADHAADADQHPAGRRLHQGVLRDLAALAVHGPDEPAGRPDPQAAALGAGAGRAVARACGVRGP